MEAKPHKGRKFDRYWWLFYLNDPPTMVVHPSSARIRLRFLNRHLRFARLLMVALLALGECLHAANDTWVGNTSANWNDPNWTGGNNPPAVSGDSLFFGMAGSAGAVLNNDFTSLSVNGITFNAGADAFVINGNSISVVSIANSSSNLQTFNTAINLANAVAFTSSAGGGNLTFNGVISNTAAHSLTVNGGGTVTLNGDNTYGAGLNTTLNGAATLVLGHDHALGNSTLLLSSSGGAGTVAASAARIISNDIRLSNTGVTGIIGGSNAITFSGNAGVGSGASGTLTVNNTAVTTFSGNVLASAGQTYALTLNGTGEVNVSGTISNGTAGTVSLAYSGSGRLTLGGANTYSGNTTLSGGGQLNLNNGGAGGTSSSLGTGTLVISGASTIDNTSGSAVTLSTNNSVTLTNNTLTFGGSNDLSFGSGGVNWQSNNQTIILNGSGSTLSFGGTMTNNQNSSNESFVVNGAGNTLVLGGFTSINHTTGKNLLLSGSGNITFTGEINNGTENNVAVSYTGTGTLSLLGASIYTGNTTLGASGSVVVGNKAAFGTGTVLWNGASLSANTDLTGSNAIANNVTLGAATNTVSGSNDLELAGAVSIGAASRTITNNMATGTFMISNTVTVGSGSGTTSFFLTFNGSGNTVISGNIVSGITGTGTAGLTYSGNGTLTLSGENAYTGTTTLSGGSLVLDFSNVAAGTGVISASSTLVLGIAKTATSQTLTLQGKDGQADVQSFAGLTFSAGGAQGGGATHIILATSGVGGSMTLNLGALTPPNPIRDISATVDISMPTGTFATTTTAAGADGLLQNNITVNGNDFATVDGAGKIVGLSTVTGGYASIAGGATSLTSNKANDIAAGGVSTGGLRVSSLRFNDGTGDSTLTINPTGNLIVASTNNQAGAILVTANVGNHLVKITGGTLQGINSRDLTLIQNNTEGLLQIDSVIADNGVNLALTKSGLGTVLLTAVNTYSSSTYINEGTLIAAGASNALGTAAGTANPANLISIARGATLQIGNNDAGGTLAATQTITNNGSVNFNRADTALAFSNVISGAGSVSQIGSGTVALTGANTYTGTTTVTSGNLQVGSSSVGQTGTGATLVNGSSAVLSGTGTVQGAATVIAGSIRPGDGGGASIGTLRFANGLTISPSTSITVASLTLGPTSGVGDKIEITGALTLNSNSNITVTFDSGYVVQTGDSWTLLDWTGVFGANGFSTGTNLELPDLAAFAGYAGQAWDVSSLADGGALTISIVAVPEPGRAFLLFAGCFCLMWRRRRGVRTVGGKE